MARRQRAADRVHGNDFREVAGTLETESPALLRQRVERNKCAEKGCEFQYDYPYEFKPPTATCISSTLGTSRRFATPGFPPDGGMRASIYNAVPETAVDALIDFMADFEKRNG